MPPIRIRAALILAQHTIGWSGKNFQRQLREAKAWKEGNKTMRYKKQDVDHVYDGCELDDAETRVKVAEILDHGMWCHHLRLRDKNDEGLLLRKSDGRGF